LFDHDTVLGGQRGGHLDRRGDDLSGVDSQWWRVLAVAQPRVRRGRRQRSGSERRVEQHGFRGEAMRTRAMRTARESQPDRRIDGDLATALAADHAHGHDRARIEVEPVTSTPTDSLVWRDGIFEPRQPRLGSDLRQPGRADPSAGRMQEHVYHTERHRAERRGCGPRGQTRQVGRCRKSCRLRATRSRPVRKPRRPCAGASVLARLKTDA